MACNEIGVRPDKPDEVTYEAVIEVEPRSLTFGTSSGAEPTVQAVQVSNIGLATLTVSELRWTRGEVFMLSEPQADGLVLEPGDVEMLDVVFQPNTSGVLSDELVLVSDAANEQISTVVVEGEGAIADLQVTPNPLDFGEQFVSCGISQPVVFENVGTETLYVSEMAWRGDVSSYGSTGVPSAPFEIAPGEALSWVVDFVPVQVGRSDVAVEISSNDPAGVTQFSILASARYAAEYSETFVVPERQPVNILFAVDQSGSMDGENATLAVEFASFLSTLASVTEDWKIGVVTLDTACFNGGILTSTTPNVEAVFASAVQLGGDEQYLTERLLELVSQATALDRPGACNDGFRDVDAPLHMIFVSDERDQSGTDWSAYWSLYSLYAADASLLTAHAVVDVNTSCGGTGASDSGPWGYQDIAVSTGGQVLDICSSNWASQLSGIAQQAVADIGVYPLTEPNVDPASIAVAVDGQRWTSGWWFDPSRQAIVFDEVLEAGQQIELAYGVTPNCP